MFEFRVVLTTTPDTAVSGEDFDSSAHSVRFESCQDIHCVDIDIVDNEQLEGTEAFSISLLGNGLDENIIVQPSAGVVVIHDDDRAVVGFEESAYQFDESVGTAVVCVAVESQRGSCVIPVSLTLSISSSDGAAVSPADYGAVYEQVRLAPCNSRVCVDISILNDVVVENDEAFTLSVTSPTPLDPRIRLKTHWVQVTINDNDAANVRLETASYTVAEDVGSFEVCINLQSPTTQRSDCPVNFDVQITFTSSDGTAVAGNDYQGVSTTLRLQRCVTRTCITVSVVNDVRMEAVRETFTLVLENTNQDSRIRVSTQPSTVYITDNDGVMISLERSVYRVTESEGAVVIVCAVVRNPHVGCPIQTPVTLRLTTRDDTATTPSDYTSLPSTIVVFDVCDTRQCVLISITNDNKVEKEEKFNVSMTRTVGLDDRVELERVLTTIEVFDTDVAAVEMESTVLTVDEDAGSVEVCASVNDTNGCRVQFGYDVTFSVTSSAAADSDDYTGVPVTLQFPVCERRLCVTVSIVDDVVVENDEDLVITVVSGGPADRITFGSETANILITDNDDAVVSLRWLYIFVPESDMRVEVCAIVKDRKSVAFSFDVTFMFIEDSATHPEDFSTTSDVVTFAPTSSKACATVTLVNSVDLEMPESFTVTLQLTNPDLDDRIVLDEAYNQGEVEIIDDDEAVLGLERMSYRLNSGANSVEVCVYVSEPSVTLCPITFPFDIIFRLTNPSPGYFVVDETQCP